MAGFGNEIVNLSVTTREIQKAMTRAVGTLIASGMISSGGAAIAASKADLTAPMNAVETALVNAANAAAKMEGGKATQKGIKYSIPETQKKRTQIVIDYTGIKAQRDALQKEKSRMESALSKCKTLTTKVSAAKYKAPKSTSAAAKAPALPGGIGGIAGSALLMAQKQMAGSVTKSVSSTVQDAAKKALEKTFNEQKNKAVLGLKTAQKYMQGVIMGVTKLISTIDRITASFQAADKTMRQKASELRAAKALERSNRYRTVTDANRNEVKASRQELINAQAEYKKAHGKESDAINSEIARLDKELYKKLASVSEVRNAFIAQLGKAKGDWMDQHSAAYAGYKGMCCAVSYAIGLYITTGKAYDPKKFAARNGYTHYKKGHISASKTYKGKDSLKDIYNNLQKGLPSMIYYKPPGHFVTVVGIRPGADINNLKVSDLRVINPAFGREEYCGAGTKIQHYRKFIK